eukprot:6269680-Prymnesium_polylepis.1
MTVDIRADGHQSKSRRSPEDRSVEDALASTCAVCLLLLRRGRPQKKVRTWSAFSGPCPDFFWARSDRFTEKVRKGGPKKTKSGHGPERT